MRFRTVAIAAIILVLTATAGLAAYQVGDEARAEAGQQIVEQSDSLAVEPDLRQKLVSDTDHDPTRYGDNSTLTVTYNGTVLESDGNYTYYQDAGEIEFAVDKSGEADIDYQYQIPDDQTADEQLKTLVRGYGDILLVGVGLSFAVLLLFIGGYVARRIGVIGSQTTRGR